VTASGIAVVFIAAAAALGNLCSSLKPSIAPRISLHWKQSLAAGRSLHQSDVSISATVVSPLRQWLINRLQRQLFTAKARPNPPHDSPSTPAATHLGPCRVSLKTDPKSKSPQTTARGPRVRSSGTFVRLTAPEALHGRGMAALGCGMGEANVAVVTRRPAPLLPARSRRREPS